MLPEARRQELLAAMGVDVYRLRTPKTGSENVPRPDPLHRTPAKKENFSNPILVIVCERAARKDRHNAQLWIDIPRALGLQPERIAWVDADESALDSAAPVARAYLALGEALAPALGALLPSAPANAATIAVAAAPAGLRGNAAAKRALWQALKPIARAIHTAERHA